MTGTTLYINVRTNTLVQSFNEGVATFTIATVTADGHGRRRKVRSASFHDNYLARDGQPHTSGYVPVNTLPGDHPNAMKTEIDRMELIDNLDKLSVSELADLILEQQRVAKEAADLVDRAKAVAKSRRTGLGTEIHGDVAMVFTSGRKFDARSAARNLTAEQLRSICELKPSAAKARKVLGEDSPEFTKCQVDNGFTLTVRPATDDDRLKAIDTSDDAEVFDLDKAPF